MNVRISIRKIAAPVLMLAGTAAGVPLRAQLHLPPLSPKALAIDPAPAMQTDGATQDLRLLVGHSIFLKTANPLRRIYVSDPKQLQSFISNPKEVVITAKEPGVGTLALWDNAGHSMLYTVSTDVDIDALRASIQRALPGQDIQVSSQGPKIYLAGSVSGDDGYKEAGRLAALYSQDVVNSLHVTYVHPKQVQLKVRMVEIDRTKLAQFGFNFFSNGTSMSTISTQQFSSVGLVPNSSGQSTIGVSNPLNFFFYNAKLNVGATVADLAAHNVLQILAEPTITTLNGHQASFLSGGEFPYPVIQGGGNTFASVTIQFQPYGVKLNFTPTVNPDGTILLKVNPEVSALDYSNAVTISGYTIPAISTRRADTEVELRDGESFTISGLLDHRTTVLLSKVPGIGDVPVLGELFRSKNNSHSVVELVVIVTATVVDPLHGSHPAPENPKMSLPNLTVGAFDKANPKGGTQ